MIKTFCPQALKCTKNDTCEHGVNKQEKDRLMQFLLPLNPFKDQPDEAYFLVGKQPCFERKK